MPLAQTVNGIVLSIVFAVLGFVLLFVGYKVFDWLTPKDLSKCIFEEGNLAVDVMTGAFVLGLAVIIASAIHG